MKKYFLLMMSFYLISSVAYLSPREVIPQSNTVDYSSMSVAELNDAFVMAVKEDHSEKIQELIQAGANVNAFIAYAWTSGDCDWDIVSTTLIYAVRHNCLNTIKALLKAKSKLNEESLIQALSEAINEGYLGAVKALIEGGVDVNYNGINWDEDAPLILAIKRARPEAEFSPQEQRKFKSRWRQRRAIIQALLKAGAKVSSVNKSGRTALMEAVKNHDLNTVLDLLKVPEIGTGSFFGFGTKPINYADKDGNTALILAIQCIRSRYVDNQQYHICMNSQNIVEKLLEFPGIDPHHVNNDGETAITLLEKLNTKKYY